MTDFEKEHGWCPYKTMQAWCGSRTLNVVVTDDLIEVKTNDPKLPSVMRVQRGEKFFDEYKQGYERVQDDRLPR
jgi:hypothetical protein